MQRLAQHNHALVRVIGHIKGVRQRNSLTKGDSGTRTGRDVFQRDGAASVVAVFIVVEIKYAIVGKPEGTVNRYIAEHSFVAVIFFSFDLQGISKF